jgi:hypothetical protein
VGSRPTSSDFGTTNTTGIWEKKSVAFLATSDSLTFSLVDLSSDFVGNDFGLDTIELIQIPEPASMLLTGSALLGAALARRKRGAGPPVR